VMARYRAAFALGDGMWWGKSQTFNVRNGYETIDVERYLQAKLGAWPWGTLVPLLHAPPLG
jgi:hypothetical protein